MSDVGISIIGYCIQHQSCLIHCVDKVTPKYFEGVERHVYRAVCEYFKQYKKCLNRKVLDQALESYGLDTDIVANGVSLFMKASREEVDLNVFLHTLDQFKREYLQRTMLRVIEGEVDEEGNQRNSLSDIVQKDPYEAYDVIRKQIALCVEETKNDYAQRGNAAGDLEKLWEKYLDTEAHPEKAYGIRTGYKLIDEETLGIRRGQLWTIGGASASGKSIFLLNMAVNMYKAGHNILLMSLEMSKESYWERFISCYCEIPEKGATKGDLSKEDKEKFRKAVEETRLEETTKGHYFRVVDIPATSALTVDAEIKRVMAECTHEPDVVFVDYLGIMRAIDKRPTDWQEQGRIAEELRQVARDLNACIITAVQLTRDKNKEAGLDRIARSKIIGETSDVFLQIMEKEDAEEESQKSGIFLPDNTMRIFFGKVRKGQMNYSIELWKDFANMRIKNKDDKSVLEKELQSLSMLGMPAEVDPVEIEANMLRPLPQAVDNGQDQKALDNGDFINV
jgi:replicative DNA helicase